MNPQNACSKNIHLIIVHLNHNFPLLASSTFRATSPSLNPPLLKHTALPSANSTLSSTAGKAHGQ